MNLDISKTNITFAPSAPISIATIVKGMDDYDNNKPSFMKVNYRPLYQRGEAWDNEFKEKLEKRTGLPVILWDERQTTISAERVLQESGVRREHRKDYIDKIAAVFILQGYLDSIRK